mgnify:CR=1 FL=1
MRYILVILLLALVLSGCSLAPGSDRDDDEDYRTGTEGLRLSFMQNLPPYKLYDDEDFNVMIKVQNVGAEDLSTGSNSRVYLSGYDEHIIRDMDRSQTIGDVEGKDQYNHQGDFTTLEYSGDIRDLSSRNIDTYPFTLLATACYGYTTIAEPTVCIDPEPHSTSSREKACNADLDPSVGTQGAPIVVNRIDVEPMKGKTKFKIHIRNAGSGTVFKDGYSYLSSCDPWDAEGLSYTDIDQVNVVSVEVSEQDITGTCKPLKDGYLRLTDGNGYIVCELKDLAGAAYTTPLRVQLEYGYRQTLRRNVKVVSSE